MLRSTFAGLNTMYRGVSTNRTSLETTGHNMTNSSVEGYSRQMVNQAATSPDGTYSSYGQVYIGSGTDALSITRARDVYADKQYRRDYADLEYCNTRQKNYQKLEVIFNDTEDTGLRGRMSDFTQSLTNLTQDAQNTDFRELVISTAESLTGSIMEATKSVQKQIEAEYDDLQICINRVNTLIDGIVQSNKAIALAEASGGYANDLRDERDNLVDELSGYMSISVTENKANGMYSVVCNGASIVNGITKIPLTLGPQYSDGRQPGIPNKYYGVTDYNIELGNTGVMLDPLSGTLAAKVDDIAEDKSYIDKMISVASFLLTDFNAQHKMGVGIKSTMENQLNDEGINKVGTPDEVIDRLNGYTAVNFFGTDGVAYIWDEENQCLNVADQTLKITAETVYADGTDARIAETDYRDHHLYTFEVTTEQINHDRDLKGIEIIQALAVNPSVQANRGKVAARSLNDTSQTTDKAAEIWSAYLPDVTSGSQTLSFTLDTMKLKVSNGSTEDINNRDQFNNPGDGSNSQLLNRLMNMDKTEAMAKVYTTANSLGGVCAENYYRVAMMSLSVDAEAMNVKVYSQEDLVDQVIQWRTSVAGVNWDEELTNMIMFQQGYSACSRCLTTMDEMLDRLINSTGVVGR